MRSSFRIVICALLVLLVFVFEVVDTSSPFVRDTHQITPTGGSSRSVTSTLAVSSEEQGNDANEDADVNPHASLQYAVLRNAVSVPILDIELGPVRGPSSSFPPEANLASWKRPPIA